jgi:FMN-dependent oxidoreductase (nitrilotriacetate monooxygenase family)
MCIGPTNHHQGSWRHPESDAHRSYDITRYQDLAQIYERGLFDGVFFVDTQYLSKPAVEFGSQFHAFDPLLVLTAMALVTRHLGLAATMSTTLHKPYYIARAFATLDHISKGRAGWNIVTSASDNDAKSYGMDQLPPKEVRYDQADQTVEACIALWNSWEEGALKFDRAAGKFGDPDKIHPVKYEGSMVRTEGILTTPRSPQGHPVFMQAGASERGLEFAARWAEAIFVHTQDKRLMQDFYNDFKKRVSDAGRDPNACKVLPSIEVIAGKTQALAEERCATIDSFAQTDMMLKGISHLLGRELSELSPDTPFADIALGPGGPRITGSYNNMLKARKDGRGLTLGEIAHLQATTWMSPRLIGSAEMIADNLQDLFESHCCDGFIITNALMPGGLIDFVELVVPELQRRGIYRTEYTGKTFRENLTE